MAEKLVQISNKAGNGFNNEIQRLSSKWKEMYAIEERVGVDEEQKMIFENDVDEEYHMMNWESLRMSKLRRSKHSICQKISEISLTTLTSALTT